MQILTDGGTKARRAFAGALLLLVMMLSGCSLLAMNDPNSNDKIRWGLAHGHAERVLKEAGSKLRPYAPDYDMKTFWTSHSEFYDFLKTSTKPGPNRFVIVYDSEKRKTYLRADLHSDENLEPNLESLMLTTATNPAFPNEPTVMRPEWISGMSYREWLIGMAVAAGKQGGDAVLIADVTIKAIAEHEAGRQDAELKRMLKGH